jgi:hypothetical protein
MKERDQGARREPICCVPVRLAVGEMSLVRIARKHIMSQRCGGELNAV